MSILTFSHPCFSNDAPKIARMHLPVAPRCNIKCGFCRPTVDACAHGCTPGVTAGILSPAQALERLEQVVAGGIDIQIVGIAGPGEPLFNEETFETISLIRNRHPHIHICLSTNGLLLPNRLDDIVALGVETLTVTVNAHTISTARSLYESVEGSARPNDFARLLERQREGISSAVRKGLVVKVNSVYVPGVNEQDIPSIARTADALGAYIYNILPVIPRERFARVTPPTADQVRHLQQLAGRHIGQFTRCRHCRADAIVDAEPDANAKPREAPAC